MKGKFKLPGTNVPMLIEINVYVPKSQIEYLTFTKYTEEELNNQVGSKFQEIVDLLALDEDNK